jgi:hypothetical protein
MDALEGGVDLRGQLGEGFFFDQELIPLVNGGLLHAPQFGFSGFALGGAAFGSSLTGCHKMSPSKKKARDGAWPFLPVQSVACKKKRQGRSKGKFWL